MLFLEKEWKLILGNLHARGAYRRRTGIAGYDAKEL